jgi:hypothetical protein
MFCFTSGRLRTDAVFFGKAYNYTGLQLLKYNMKSGVVKR